MRAALLTEYGKPLEIEEVSTAPLGLRDARVRIDASGVCHSDVTIAAGGIPGMELPVILGHEGAGTILETGAEVTRVKTGDRVIMALFPVCGQCFHCIRDESHLCETLGAISMTPRMRRADGAGLRSLSALGTFADEAVIDESLLVKVDTDLPSEELALLGCGVTTGVGAALNTARVTPGATVAVVGCGGVGQSVLQGARIAGASRIFAVDPVELKRKTAEQLGATDLIDPNQGDPVEQVKAATGGPRRRFLLRGARTPRDDVAGLQHGAPARDGDHGRHGPRRAHRHLLDAAAADGGEALPAVALRLVAGAPRPPAVRVARRDRPARPQHDGLAPHQARRRQRRVPRDDRGRGHPLRHRVTGARLWFRVSCCTAS